MKLLLNLLVILLLVIAPTPKAVAQESVSMDFFYDNLQPYGTWREVGSYGYCWQPREVDADWRPFSEGRWVYTDAGWTWDSDEAFGWAVYHYGRWANVDDMGWIWIPGMEWSPGWVSWRHNSDYIGWAPLPPEAHFRHETGFRGWVDDYYDIGPRNYCFVTARDFGARRLRSVFIDARQNLTIIRETTNITNIYYENNLIHNDGPRYESLAKVSRNPIAHYKLERRQRFEEDPRNWREEHGRSRVSDDSFSLFAPSFKEHGKEGPRNTGVKLERPQVNRGWQHAGSEPEVDELRKAMRSKVKPPEDLPRPPKFPNPVENSKPKNDPRDAKNEGPSKIKPNQEQPPGVRDHPPVTPEEKPKKSERPPGPDSDKAKPRENKDPSEPARPHSNDRPPEPEIRKPRPAEPKAERVEPRREPEVRQPKSEKPQADPRPKQRPPEAKPPQREPKSEPKREPQSEPKREPQSEPKREPQSGPKREPQSGPKREPQQPEAKPSQGPKKPDTSDEENDQRKGKGKKKDNTTL